MQERITSREFAEWMAYARLEPFGEERADLRNAMLMALVYNLLSGQDDERREAIDFMPRFEADEDTLAVEQADRATEKAKALFSFLGATRKKTNGNPGANDRKTGG